MATDTPSRGEAFERLVAELFRKAGWKIKRQSAGKAPRADLIVQRANQVYVVEVKSAPEGRRDRLVPLLAQAILQARVLAERSPRPAAPLAVVAARRVGESLVRDLGRFAQDYAPDAAIGLVDLDGFQWFRGPGLESLNVRQGRSDPRMRAQVAEPTASHLFSDLNQWMLKVILAPRVPLDLLQAPRGEYQNASQLAAAANVSVMSAFRLVRQLRQDGFLDESSPSFRLVRLDELLNRWRAASQGPVRERPMRWVLRGNPEQQLHEALRGWVSTTADTRLSHGVGTPGRACVGLFAAAKELGLGFVHGLAPHIYLERYEPKTLRRLGLSMEAPAASPDLYVRRPAPRESVFRAAVRRDGVPISDVLQVWLDVSAHPSRGSEQADLIYRRVLRPLIKGR